MNTREVICTVCPVGCRITVTDCQGSLSVTGNGCLRGERHAISECTHPMRMVTTTVTLQGANIRRLPVISNKEVPRERLEDCLKTLYSVSVQAPVRCGDIIVADICSTGVDIVAARTIEGGQPG